MEKIIGGIKNEIASWRYHLGAMLGCKQDYLLVQNCSETSRTSHKFLVHLCHLNYIIIKNLIFYQPI